MSKKLSILGSVAVGAGLAYFLDPVNGRRRRRRFRDRALSQGREIAQVLDATARDLRNRMIGAFGEARYQIKGQAVDDDILALRVDAKVGHCVSHPKSVVVSVENGRVALRGFAMAREIPDLVRTVARIPGVKSVHNEIEAHPAADGMPALQGG